MRTKYTINELLFKAYLICVVLGCILRNMFGEWKPIYDTGNKITDVEIASKKTD